MQIDSSFAVVAPIGTVWATLMDFERVAGCLPGARILNKLSEDAYQVGMTVKLGPVNMQYKGLLNVLERDPAEHRAVLGGKAQETRGQGTAEATVTMALTEDGTTTKGTVSANLALSGKAAAMGKSVIGSVTEQMMGLFADNLQSMLTEPPAPAVDGAVDAAGEPAPPAPAPAVAAPVPATTGTGTPSASPTAAPSTRVPTPSSNLDVFSLARGVAVDQLSSPGKVVGVVAAVACLSYWAGRRSAFRMLRLCGRL